MCACFDKPGITGSGGSVDIGAVEFAVARVTNVLMDSTIAIPPLDAYSFDEVDGSEEQLRTVPIGALNQIAVRFSQDVLIPLALQGSLIGALVSLNREVTIPDVVDFDAPTEENNFTATWILDPDEPLFAAQYLLRFDESIESLDGYGLDGEWTNPVSVLTDAASSAFPSGDRVEGGEFEFVFSILQGDMDRDNSVTDPDFDVFLHMLVNRPLYSAGIQSLGDINRSGSAGFGADVIAFSNLVHSSPYPKNLRDLVIIGDFDGDYDVDEFDEADFDDFLAQSDLRADLNRDGLLNSADEDAFEERLGIDLEVTPLESLNVMPTDDSFVTSVPPGFNYGDEETLYVGGEGNIIESYLRFDLSQLTSDFDAVTVQLTPESVTSNGTINAIAPLVFGTSIDEDTLTYNNRPTTFGPTYRTWTPIAGETVSLDVTELARWTLEFGDLDFDGALDFTGPAGDLAAIDAALANLSSYAAGIGRTEAEVIRRGDANRDGVFNISDLDGVFARHGVIRGDLDFDGVVEASVNGDDYDIFIDLLGAGTGQDYDQPGLELMADMNKNGSLTFTDSAAFSAANNATAAAPTGAILTLRISAPDSAHDDPVIYTSKEGDEELAPKLVPSFISEVEAPTDDSFVTSVPPGFNYGDEETLYVGGEGNIIESYLRFDLSQLTSDFDAVTVQLTPESVTSNGTINAISPLVFGTSIDEDTLTYNNRPTTFGPTYRTWTPIAGETVSLDVTELARWTLEFGDLDFDGALDFTGPAGDLAAIDAALANLSSYAAGIGRTEAEVIRRGDANRDGVFNISDLDGVFARHGVIRGDLDFDGVVEASVNGDDYDIFIDLLGAGTGQDYDQPGLELMADMNKNGSLTFTDSAAFSAANNATAAAPTGAILTLRISAPDSAHDDPVIYTSKEGDEELAP